MEKTDRLWLLPYLVVRPTETGSGVGGKAGGCGVLKAKGRGIS